MKELEFKTTAKNSEEMVKRLEAAIGLFKDGYLDARVFEDEQEEDPCEGCDGCDEVDPVLGVTYEECVHDLQQAIATLVYYDLDIPHSLVQMYNNVLEEWNRKPCPLCDEDEEEDDD